MCVHIFGAADSPCCANYAVRRTAKDNADCFSELAIQTVLRDFYVDDLITSVPSEQKATELAHELANLLNKGGFRLCQWMSNRVGFLATFEDKDRAVQNLNLDLDEFPVQRALGPKWNVSEDCFIFSPYLKPITHTKRGIVSTVLFKSCGGQSVTGMIVFQTNSLYFGMVGLRNYRTWKTLSCPDTISNSHRSLQQCQYTYLPMPQKRDLVQWCISTMKMMIKL